MILRQVRDYMDVGQLNKLETKKQYLLHNDSSKNFGRWLMVKIGL